jgi:hypothetical protein
VYDFLGASRMKLFDGVETFGDRTIFHNESEFDYLQGSARPEMIRVKDLLESWFAEYPDEKKERLRTHLRGKKSSGQKLKQSLREATFHQAFFELYIFILLRRLGCQVKVEESVDEPDRKRTAPDFLATHVGTGYSFYVEATVQADGRAREYENFLREVKAALDQIDSPEFVICMRHPRIRSKDWHPSTSRLVKYVAKKLSQVRTNPSPRNLGPFTFEGNRWTLPFHFEARTQQENWVGQSRSLKESPSTRAVNSVANIRKAVKDKASHYESLKHPFIIAINVMEHLVNPHTVLESLYGSVSHVYKVVAGESSAIGDLEFSGVRPKCNGAFCTRRPQNTRVAAIWVASSLMGPSSIGSARLYQFDNFFARNKFVPTFPCLSRCYLDDAGKLAVENGLTPQQLLGIESHWPEDVPPPKMDFAKWLCE